MSTISNDIVFSIAERSERAPKIALSGPSGAGKTLSALMLACGIVDAPTMPELTATGKWSDIVVADAENGASKLYVNTCFNYKNYKGEISCIEIGKFTHIDFKPPFAWQRWVRIIEEASKRGRCLILDHISAEWSGQGGILDKSSTAWAPSSFSAITRCIPTWANAWLNDSDMTNKSAK